MKRNHRAGVEDRWTKTLYDDHGNKQKVPSANYGKGKRWRARYVDDQGSEHAKAFDKKKDATGWLASGVTAKLATGTYVAPKAGLVSVGAVYALWSASQAHLAPKTAATQRSLWKSTSAHSGVRCPWLT
jgi:hypothetical protein